MKSTDDNLVDEILTQLESMPDGVDFEHAYVPKPLDEVIALLRAMRAMKARSFRSELTDREGWVLHRKAYLSGCRENATLIWTPGCDTDLLRGLSLSIDSPIFWISVSQPMKLWAFAEYGNGKLMRKILDPKVVWETGALNGDILMGQGEREYSSMEHFLGTIAPSYQPVDQLWSFSAWDDVETRNELLSAVPAPEIAWSIEVDFEPTPVKLTPIGFVPDKVRPLLERT